MTTLQNNNFKKTNKKVRITFGGWDGKSYNGESINTTVFTNPDYPEKIFVRSRRKSTLIYHEVKNELHPITNVNTVCVFCYFDK